MKEKTDLKKLRELAVNATPGPWACAGGIYVYSRDAMIADNNDETALVRARGVGGGMSREQQEANVEFVSAANPQAIIELLDRLNEAESAIKDLELYWIGSYRGGESARRYALNWGIK